jgi:hypothetical protein
LNCAFSQKITYTDLAKLASQSTDQSAELLISKGFELRWASDKFWEYKSFEIKSGTDDNINVDFYLYRDGAEEIKSCFSQKFDKDFKALEAQVKAKAKKLRFFFYSDLKLYLTEYQLGDKYLYLSKGLCWHEKTNFKYGTFIISSKRYE